MDPFEEGGAVQSFPLDWHVSFWEQYVDYVGANLNAAYAAIP